MNILIFLQIMSPDSAHSQMTLLNQKSSKESLTQSKNYRERAVRKEQDKKFSHHQTKKLPHRLPLRKYSSSQSLFPAISYPSPHLTNCLGKTSIASFLTLQIALNKRKMSNQQEIQNKPFIILSSLADYLRWKSYAISKLRQ